MTKHKLTADELDHAIATACTPKQRDALQLLADGYSEREAARQLQISRSSFRSRVASATHQLRNHLDLEEAA